MHTLLKLKPGLLEAYEEDMRIKMFKKQNPGKDTHEARDVLPRQFQEIGGMKQFNDVCKSHKACAIAILPAITTIDYELDNFNEKIEILREMDEKAGKSSSPIHYAWVNATCHVSNLS